MSGVLYRQDNRWHGGVGVSDMFTFTPPAGVTDVDHYLYGWKPDPVDKVDAQSLGGPTSVPLAPLRDGPQGLYVRSVDRAGHKSPVSVYRFYVRAGNRPLVRWSFEGNARDSAFLGDRHGTLGGGATYTAQGAVGAAVELDGEDDHVSAPNAVRNDTAFTVSAWVKVKDVGGSRAAVSQDGARSPGSSCGAGQSPTGPAPGGRSAWHTSAHTPQEGHQATTNR